MDSTETSSLLASANVYVVRKGAAFRLHASRGFAPEASILTIHGILLPVPNTYSIQVGPGEHLDAPPGLDLETLMDHYPFRFLNHGCVPNARWDGGELVAAAAIAEGEEITFDYETTEALMATPFRCTCGAPRCRGWIRGHGWGGPPAS